MDTIKKYLSSNKEYLITLVNSKNAAQELLNTHSVNKYDSKYIIDVLNANYVMNGNLKNSSEELLLVLHNDGNIAQISSQSFEKVNVTATIEYDSEKNFLLETGLFEVYRYLDNNRFFIVKFSMMSITLVKLLLIIIYKVNKLKVRLFLAH